MCGNQIELNTNFWQGQTKLNSCCSDLPIIFWSKTKKSAVRSYRGAHAPLWVYTFCHLDVEMAAISGPGAHLSIHVQSGPCSWFSKICFTPLDFTFTDLPHARGWQKVIAIQFSFLIIVTPFLGWPVPFQTSKPEQQRINLIWPKVKLLQHHW